jgi:hypothetical protein
MRGRPRASLPSIESRAREVVFGWLRCSACHGHGMRCSPARPVELDDMKAGQFGPMAAMYGRDPVAVMRSASHVACVTPPRALQHQKSGNGLQNILLFSLDPSSNGEIDRRHFAPLFHQPLRCAAAWAYRPTLSLAGARASHALCHPLSVTLVDRAGGCLCVHSWGATPAEPKVGWRDGQRMRYTTEDLAGRHLPEHAASVGQLRC